MALQQYALQTDAGELSYRAAGTGNVVVLLHGFGEDSRIWYQQAAFLEQLGYRVLLPDFPGSGSSTLSEHTIITIEWLAAVVNSLLEHEKVSSCILLGHSMGGYVTLAFAEKWPEKLLGFGLIHSTAFADSEDKKEARRKSMAFIREKGTRPFLQATLPNLFGLRFQDQQPDAINTLLQWAATISASALTGYYAAMLQRPDRTAVLQKAEVPVLFFIGAEDKAVSPEDALLQSSFPSVALVKKVEGIAHMGMWEAADELHELLLQYLQVVFPSTNQPTA